MSCEQRETNGMQFSSVNVENLLIDHGHVLHREELHLKRTKSNHNRPMKRCITIYGHDCAPFGEWSSPFDGRLIADGGSRLILIA